MSEADPISEDELSLAGAEFFAMYDREEAVRDAQSHFETLNSRLALRDAKHLWHPCTQQKDHEHYPLIPIARGEGVYLYDHDGNRYIDAISSWWVNLFGHANPTINAALAQQAATLEHVIFAGFTHEPAIRLAERLVDITPAGLERVFLTDNGSSAVEIALKMSFHYWQNVGQPQKKDFVNLAGSYHGETLGALAVGDVELYKKTYEPLLMRPRTVASPDCYHRDPGESWEAHSLRQFKFMRRELEQHHATIAAVIVEPLIQCAGNMRMYSPIYLTKLRELCTEFNVHLIVDEIAVGFGRTGTMFACEQATSPQTKSPETKSPETKSPETSGIGANRAPTFDPRLHDAKASAPRPTHVRLRSKRRLSPDFLCVGKGLTGGYLPLSAVLTTDNVYRAFYDNYETLRAFLHSHSYTGNPLSCAVANATLDIFETENTIEKNQTLAQTMRDAFAHLSDHPHVAEVRQTGMVLAIEMVVDKKTKEPYPWQERRGLTVYQHGLKNECLLRPIGNVIYLMPPYIITPDQIQHLARVATEGIELATT